MAILDFNLNMIVPAIHYFCRELNNRIVYPEL